MRSCICLVPTEDNDLQEVELLSIVSSNMGLETKIESSVRSRNTLNHRVKMSSASQINSFL